MSLSVAPKPKDESQESLSSYYESQERLKYKGESSAFKVVAVKGKSVSFQVVAVKAKRVESSYGENQQRLIAVKVESV